MVSSREERGLPGELLPAELHGGIRNDLDVRRPGLTEGGDADAVAARRHERTVLRPPEDRLRDERRLQAPEVPRETVQAGDRLEGLLHRALRLLRGLLVALLAREAAEDLLPVENLEGDELGLLRCVLQPEGDDGARGGVLPRALRWLCGITTARDAGGVPRREQVQLRGGDVVLPLPERGEIVQDPEGAALRRHDEVSVLHDEVGDRHDREVPLEAGPRPAVVQGEVETGLRSREEEALPPGVLADDAREGVAGDTGVDPSPGRPEVGRFPEVGSEVAELVERSGEVRRPGGVGRGLDRVHLGPLGEPLRRHVLPRRAAVARHVDEPVVAPGPEEPLLQRRLREREDRAVDLDAGVVLRDRAARGALLRLVVPRQVGRDLLPALPLVPRLEEDLRGVPEDVRVVPRDEDRARSTGCGTSGRSRAGRSASCGQAVISRSSPVRWSYRVIDPP